MPFFLADTQEGTEPQMEKRVVSGSDLDKNLAHRVRHQFILRSKKNNFKHRQCRAYKMRAQSLDS